MANLMIVDDHKLFRDGLSFIIREIEGIDKITEASNGQEFLDLIEVEQPDLVLMDINMPVLDGMEASKRALARYPNLNLVILSMYGEEQYYNSMIDIGVKGFVLKDADNKELKLAVRTVLDGGSFFSQRLLINLIKNRNERGSQVSLSPREYDVLHLLCKGYSTIQISDELHISPRTVERHRADLLSKTGATNSISLVIYAIKNNLVTI
jgi:DNA-binding NarL/FixJ family response regulator